MPFIPPVSIARSVSGLTGKESISSASTVNKPSREDRGGSVKERITMNLKNLGKKEQPRSCGPAKGGVIEGKRRDKPKVPKQAGGLNTASAAAAPSQGSVKAAGAELRSRMEVQEEEEAHFTLTLTPEAVLLLQRRSSERPHRAGCGGTSEARANERRRDNPSKRRSTSPHRVSPKISGEPEIDLRSILKISLLNERHKYDDVEYEEEEEYGLDQRVALKCTEWLRGLESPLIGAVTITGGVTGVTTAGGVGGWKGNTKNC